MSRYLTPLRYPGGKQKLAPFIIEILQANSLYGGSYVEPYAGGAGVALDLLINKYVDNIYLNDSSFPIYAFWNSVIKKPEELCRMISKASLTVDEWKKRREIVKNPSEFTEIEVGYSTFYLNRCNRSGVLSGGLIGGLSQNGKWRMDARFPRNELIRRIEIIASKKNNIFVSNLDAEDYILNKIPSLPEKTLIYCDPPYFEKAQGLYLNAYREKDHQRISNIIQNNLNKKWIVSYDSAPQILSYYKERNHFLYDLQYNVSRVYKGKEIFVFSDDLIIPETSKLPYISSALTDFNKIKNI